MKTTAGLHNRPKFDPAARLVAGRTLRWKMPDDTYRDVQAGETFDLEELGCDLQLAERLYRTRGVEMVVDDSPPRPASIKHLGFGNWAVLDENGAIIEERLTKDDARAKLGA